MSWKEIKQNAYTIKKDNHETWLLRLTTVLVFFLGFSVGVALALYILRLRGLI
jgi:hypothetical protein